MLLRVGRASKFRMLWMLIGRMGILHSVTDGEHGQISYVVDVDRSYENVAYYLGSGAQPNTIRYWVLPGVMIILLSVIGGRLAKYHMFWMLRMYFNNQKGY